MSQVCHLLRLPAELRVSIWKQLFNSTTLASGEQTVRRVQTTLYKPAEHSLAILRACRLINEETQDLWLSRVLFDFTDMDWLLNKLTAVTARVLSQIRYVKLSAMPLMLSPREYYDDIYYRLADALILIPGLQLETLIVDTTEQTPEVVYETVKGLIEGGDGFHELRILLPNTAPFAFEESTVMFGQLAGPLYRREPQPQSWQKTLETRDGGDSGASVAIYQVSEAGGVVDPWDTSTVRPFSQVESPDFGIMKDAVLMSGPDADKGLLIVAKRGRGAVIEQGRGKPPFNLQDLRDWTYGLSWDEIKEISNRWMTDLRDDAMDWRFDDELPSPVAVGEIPRTGVRRGNDR